MRTLKSISFLLLLTVATSGCGDDAAAKEPGSCKFPGAGVGAASLTAAAPVTLDTRTDKAMNSAEFESKGQLGAPALGPLAHGPCGKAGLLLWTSVGSDTQLGYVDPKAGGTPEVVVAKVNASGRSAALLLDAACNPVVIRRATSMSGGIEQYTRSAAKTWDKAAALADPTTLLGGKATSLSLVAAHVDGAGKMVLFAHAAVGKAESLLRGERDSKAGAAWSFKKLPRPAGNLFYAYQAGPSGSTHALYRNTSYPCDPCNMDVYHGTLASGASSWSQETVRAGKWGDPNDEFLASSSLAFDKAGALVIAAHFQRSVITGSYKNTELHLYGQSGGGWCGEALATKNAGYVGSDGDTFTGEGPRLLLGPAGRRFILFRDQSVWHAQGQQNQMGGNLRLATGSGSSWSTTTLLSQKGQTASKNPLYGCYNPQMSVSADGKEVIVACVETTWQSASSYNNSAVPVTYTVKAVTAVVK